MKKQVKWLLSALALVAVLVIAVVLYRHLSDRYTPETVTHTVAAAQDETVREASDMSDEPDVPQEPDAPEEIADPDSSAAKQELAPSEDLAADFAVLDENNKEVRLSERFGKPIVVNFWASWCGPCCSELPAFDAAAKQYAGKIDFMMVNLTDGRSETVDSVRSFIEENGYTFPVYFDTSEEAADAYSVYSIPLSVFIRADGTVMDSHVGSMQEDVLQGYLDQLLG